jgi:NADH:ubiquinone oxidoreductase subunit 4 (subunit M)
MFFFLFFFLNFFDRSSNDYQFIYRNVIFNENINNFINSYLININKIILLNMDIKTSSLSIFINKFVISFGIDGISLFFILLSTFTIPLCLLTSYKNNLIYVKDYCLYLLILEIFLILSFSAIDLITFFIFFESILIPMFFIIGI